MNIKKIRRAPILVVAASLLFLGVVSNVGLASASSSKANAIKVPTSIKKSGVLTVGSWLEYPPFDYQLHGKQAGMDVQLLHAIGSVLGLKIKFTNIQWSAVLTSMVTGRYNLVSDEMADTTTRRAGGVDFVDYYKINDQIEVKAGNPYHVNIKDLCGTSFTTNAGSWEQTLLVKDNAACTKSGKKPIAITYLTDYASENEAVETGRVDATINNSASAAYEVANTHKTLEVLPGIVPGSSAGVAGFIFQKGDKSLEHPFMAAINQLEKNGKWQSILAKYGAVPDMVKPARLNGKSYNG